MPFNKKFVLKAMPSMGNDMPSMGKNMKVLKKAMKVLKNTKNDLLMALAVIDQIVDGKSAVDHNRSAKALELSGKNNFKAAEKRFSRLKLKYQLGPVEKEKKKKKAKEEKKFKSEEKVNEDEDDDDEEMEEDVVKQENTA